MNETKKKDLIDLVREGHPIEIYEDKSLMQEGDEIKADPFYKDRIYYVGKRIGGRLFGWWFTSHRCVWCNTPMHYIRYVQTYYYVGRNGRTYTQQEVFESQYVGRICPRCGFQDKAGYTS